MAAGELNRWWRIGLPVVAPLVRLLFRVRVAGLEHVPTTGPAILVFNHVSTFDGPVLAIETSRRLRRETRFLVASEFFAKPFFGWILRRFDQIKIRRPDIARAKQVLGWEPRVSFDDGMRRTIEWFKERV